MDIQATKLSVMQKIMSVTTESLLQKINQLLDNEMTVGYTTKGEPLTKAQYNARLEEAERQIKAGEYTTHEDLKKEIENW